MAEIRRHEERSVRSLSFLEISRSILVCKHRERPSLLGFTLEKLQVRCPDLTEVPAFPEALQENAERDAVFLVISALARNHFSKGTVLLR